MQIELELLAPAKNKDIGIAAIDCGADAVYIAGPKFGARESAGNSFSDIAELASYAHKFGAKVYMVVNTILYDNELEEAQKSISKAWEIGCDAVIVQDLSVLKMDLPPIPLFASTQTNIRTTEQAKFLESLGFQRLILARELSLEQISDIKKSVGADIETFVHGALCVSYSGQCYLSQKLTGRSANRGACAQACRSLYTLIDSSGKVLLKDFPILSLKDFNLSERIPELVKAGVTSFKIEGRLKNVSYIKNIVRLYREKLDLFLAENPL
ncbi:MAG: U32 family peptidase, partial [Bacteroidales bacterium]|nr:U32 family peptidase [Bacteroidales bacterium]